MDTWIDYPEIISGYRVVSSPLATEPTLRLSMDVDVSDGFREEFNAWLEATFGRRPCAYVFDASKLLADVTPEIFGAMGPSQAAPTVICHDDLIRTLRSLK